MPKHHPPHKQEEDKHWTDKFLRPGLHKDWRTWLVIGLMVAAMGIYILTLDDSTQPGSAPQGRVQGATVPQ
jgi:hypothetical protein